MEPTCVDTIVQTVPEAHMLMYAVLRAMRPLIHRRPCNDDERATIRPGAVFVWEEGSGIERWTDRREWGDSRSREDFLFYTEGPKASSRPSGDTTTLPSPTIPKEEPLVKQTYTALVDRGEGLRKWHLIAYFKESTKHELRPVSHDPELACLEVPPDTFKQARLPKSRRARDRAWSGPGAPFQSLRPSTSGGKDNNGGSASGSHYVGTGGDRDMMLKPVDTALRPYRMSASTTVRSNWSNASSDTGRYAGDQNVWPGYSQHQPTRPHHVGEYHHTYHEPETPTRYVNMPLPILEKEKRSPPGSHSPTLVDEHPYVMPPFHELRPLRELLVTMGLGASDGQGRRSSPLNNDATPPIAMALHEVRPIRDASDPVGTIHTSDERVRRRTPLDEQVLQRLFVQSVA